MKFVGIRWLENLPVASRLILILDDLHKYVQAINEKKVKTTISKSVQRMIDAFDNIAQLRARLQFFVSIAVELEPFLREFQSNLPFSVWNVTGHFKRSPQEVC